MAGVREMDDPAYTPLEPQTALGACLACEEAANVNRTTPAPEDKDAVAVWGLIMPMAAAAGLIVQAYGGVATLATPEQQRKAKVRETVLGACLYKTES